MTMAINEIVRNLPAASEGPVETWSHGELLNEAARHGLRRRHEFLTLHPITAEMPLKDAKMVVDAALTRARLLANVQMMSLQPRPPDRAILLERAAERFKEELDEHHNELLAERAERKAAAAR
jgi:hypothetical protein